MITVLVAQLVLSLLAPPFDLGERKLFLGDLWFLLWTSVGLVQHRQALWKKLLLPAGVMAVAYLHAKFREVLPPQFGLEPFQPFRELVVAVRFFSWLAGGFLVGQWFRALSPSAQSKSFQVLLRTSGGLGAFIVTTMLVGKVYPPLQFFLGKLYDYDPSNISWQGRMYGTFASPNEAGITLGLIGLLFATSYSGRWMEPLRAVGGLVSGLGVALAHTFTAVVALSSGIGASYAYEFRKSTRWLLLGSFVAAIALLLYLSPGKIGHFSGRFTAWNFQLILGTSSWHGFLFGQGFHAMNVDNFYLFTFSRGGMLAVATLITGLVFWFRKNFHLWSFRQRAVLFFGLAAGLSLDVFILRPFAAVWVVAVVPLFCVTSQRASKPRARRA